jgi:hypothetical protein
VTNSPRLENQRNILQSNGFLVTGAEESVQRGRLDGRRHGDHENESVTMRQGSTLSAPVAPDSVIVTCLPD